MLAPQQIGHFISEGFVRVDQAFPRRIAEEARAILWRDTGCDPQDPASWTRPVVRLGDYAEEPFRLAANTPVLHQAFDQLVGQGRWLPRASLGSFPIRFPSPDDPGDAGWHIDVSFAGPESDPANFMTWRANIKSGNLSFLEITPSDPIDDLTFADGKIVWRDLISKQDQILTWPPGAWRKDSVKAQKGCSITNLLCALIGQTRVVFARDPQFFKRIKVDNFEGTIRPHFYPMKH